MKAIKFCFLLTTLLYLLAMPALAQDTDKAILLKGVGPLPLPNSSSSVSSIITINNVPQIIATAQLKDENVNQYNVIATTRLKKGRIVVFGSSAYFKQPLLANTNVRQLILNTLDWADQKKTKTVQIWGETGLQKILTAQGYHVTLAKNTIIESAGVIILTEDIKDSINRAPLKKFIQLGGTLILTSPISENRYQDLRFNATLTRAGLYISDKFLFPVNKSMLITGDAPPYLHIATIMQAIQTNEYKKWTEDQLRNAALTLIPALSQNTLNSAIIAEIKKLLYLDIVPVIIPSPQIPVLKSDGQTYFTYLAQQILKKRQHDEGGINPAANTFPGKVADTAARINTSITIPVQVGSQGLWEPEPVFYRWHSTGLYVPAGENVTIVLNNKYHNQHLKAQIGVHEDGLLEADEFLRTPFDLTRSFGLRTDTTTIHSAYGGILLIKIADTCTLKNITINVNGAVKYPYFKLGTTTLADWKNSIRNYDAPWAELASDKIILTVPASRIRFLDDPEKLLKFWDEVMDADAKLAVISPIRKHPERIITDAQVAYGALFTTDHKIIGPDGQATMEMLNEHFMRTEGSWGYFHELGHRHQFWGLDFDGTGEVTVNLYSMYILDKVLHKGIYSPPNIADKQTVIEQTKEYMADNPSFEKWKTNPFVALRMYIEIIEGFGWGPIEHVYRNFRAIPLSKYPKTDAQKRDLWFTQISKATHKNLSAFFDKWKIPVTAKAKKQVSMYPVWLPAELKK